MAEKLEMSVNGYANIERGETDVQISRLEQIAEILDVDLVELMRFGERNIICFLGDNNQHVGDNNQHILQTLNMSPEALLMELQKCQVLLQERDKEIQYLKEIISLMKKPGVQE